MFYGNLGQNKKSYLSNRRSQCFCSDPNVEGRKVTDASMIKILLISILVISDGIFFPLISK